MPPTAVLLAFDGMLADTENFHAAAWQRTLSRLGWDLPDAVAARSINCDDYTFAVEVFCRMGVVQADLDGWVARKRGLMLEMARNAPRLFPGAAELVDALAGRVRLVLTAESRRDAVDATLGKFGLLRAFDLIVADDDVAAPRPDAARLHQAVKRLKRKSRSKTRPAPPIAGPEDVIAVEGTADGVRTAVRGGIPVLAVGHHRPSGEWVGDAPFIQGLAPVVDVLERIGLGGGA